MGTNFYAKMNMRARDKERIKHHIESLSGALDSNNAVKFGGALDDLIYDWGEVKQETIVHLGKRSGGWAFLWDLNNMKYYKPTLESIISFIKESDAVIEDEYGAAFTMEEFLNDEIGYCLRPSETPLTLEEVNKSDLLETTKDYVKKNFFDKGLPYYRFCTAKTYHEMHPNEPAAQFYRDSYNHRKLVEECSEYTDAPIMLGDTDFVTRDKLRFALYTDFS